MRTICSASKNLAISTAVIFMLFSGPASAQQVMASLVSRTDSVQAGQSVTVALRLEHQPGWHTYWLSPGIGEATKLKWVLPDGWNAGGIQWPAPHTIHGPDGKVTGHGYAEVIHLPVTITAPADAVSGETVLLKATASWLMCNPEHCIPGKADLKLQLPVVDQLPSVNMLVDQALAATPMPESSDAYNILASRSGNEIILRVAGEANFENPHFFSADELIYHDSRQRYLLKPKLLQAKLLIDKYYEGEPSRLMGVLAFTDGQGRYRGIQIDLPLTNL